MKSWWGAVCVAASLGLAVLLSGCGSEAPTTGRSPESPAPAALPQADAPPAVPVELNGAGLPDFSKLVDAFGPTVVNVATVGRMPAGHEGCRASRRTTRCASSSSASALARRRDRDAVPRRGASYAAINIVSTIEQVAFVVFIGISNATSVLVGNRIGAGKEEQAFLYAGRSLGLGVVGGVLVGLILQVVKWPILSLYNVSPEVIYDASRIINVMSLFLCIRVNNMTIVVGILRAGGDTRFSLFLDGMIIWIVGVPMAFIAAFVLHLPVYYVYLAAMSEECAKWLLGVPRYRSRKWIHNLAAQVEGI